MYDELVEVEYDRGVLYLNFKVYNGLIVHRANMALDSADGEANINLSKEDAKKIRDYLNGVVFE